MKKKQICPYLTALSGLCINISAAYFIAVLVGPSLTPIRNIEDLLSLTSNLLLGIVFLILTIFIERKL